MRDGHLHVMEEEKEQRMESGDRTLRIPYIPSTFSSIKH